MIFAEQPGRWKDWTIEILGTDVSNKAIATARSGQYTQFEIQRPLIDQAGIPFGAGYGDLLAVLQHFGGIATTDHSRNAQFTGNDGGVTGAAAAIGHDGGGAFHDRLPIRVGHVGHQHVAGLNPIHFVDAGDDLDHE